MPELENMDALIFIDTNIFLDFYRERKSDVSLQFLEKVEKFKDRIIISAQVEMEYKKNRQVVILESLKNFNAQGNGKPGLPAFVLDSQAGKTFNKKRAEGATQHKKLTEKIGKILQNPSTNDEVYKVLQRLFKYSSSLNLNRDSKQRFAIRKLAIKRFYLGYPPRKKSDSSIGDAINWEWIIQCSIETGKDIVIVSRDGDYGVNYESKLHLNDWLHQEFKQRVSRKRKIMLTDKLSIALKIINAGVTNEMEEAEKELVKEYRKESV